jgi:hypothetical protein
MSHSLLRCISLFLLLGCSCVRLYAVDYYWVGGSGNWSSLSNWSKVSGSTAPGDLHTALPGIADDVYFDANSFTAPGQTVTINVNASCRQMSWIGATNNPTLAGTNAFTLTVHNSFTLIPAMNYTFAGTVIFRGLTGTWTITTAGKTLASVDITAAQAGSTFQLADPLTVTNTIRLLEGGFNTNGQAVNAAALLVPAQPAPVPVRSLTLNGSAVTLTGTGTVLNLSNNANFTLAINAASSFEFTNAGNITIELGTVANFNGAPLNFSNPTTANTTIAINSNNSANPLQFGNINVARSNSTFTINSNRPKIYQNITLGDNINGTFTGATTTDNIFNGNIVAGNYTVANNRRLVFNSRNLFNGSVTIGNSGVNFNSILQFTNTSTFNGAVTLGNNGRIEFTTTTVQHFFNPSSSLTLGANGWILANQTGATAQVTLNNITMPPGSILQISPTATQPTVINGTINIAINCGTPVTWRSATLGSSANISIGTAQTVGYLTVRDLNNSGALLTINNGTNLGTNTGNFVFNTTSQNFYWIGGTGNWSDGNKWSLSSGGAPAGCTPNVTDNVFFDANSFTAVGQTVTIDVPAFCNNMDWTGALFTPSLAGTQQLTIGGSLTFINAMTQTGAAPTYTGTVQFIADNPATITMAGKRLNNVEFFGSGNWTLQDQFYLVAALNLIQGTLNTNNQVLNVNRIDAGLVSDLVRTLDLGNAIHILRENATVLNLTGNNITFNAGTSTLRATGNGNVTIVTGSTTKTLPPIEFITAGGTATINTGTGAGRITFGNITSAKVNLTISGTTLRTFNDITLTNTAAKTILWDGSTLASPNRDIVNGVITFPAATTATLNASIDFAPGSSMTIGANSTLTVNAGSDFSDLTVGASSNVTFNNSSNFNNLTANTFSTFRFRDGQTFNFVNNLVLNADCASWIRLGSTLAGVQTNLSFGALVQNWTGVILQDVNIAAGTVNATAATDVGNNTGFATLSPNVGVPLYWVGGTGNWSDSNHWSLTSGGAPSGCIPSPDSDVIFDNNSFPAGGTVTIDQPTVFAKTMTWSSTNAATLTGTVTRTIQLYGGVNWSGAALTNNFLGTIELTGVTAGSTKTLNWGGITVQGNLVFNNNNDVWQLASDLAMVNNPTVANPANFTIVHGKVKAQTHTISVGGNWTILPPVAPLTISQFDPGTGTVRFYGTTATQTLSAYNTAVYGTDDACSTVATSPFYNLEVNKTAAAAGRVLDIQGYSISILNNFTINSGEVRDNGNQIRGNTSGTITIANNTKLRLGGANVDGSATVFPTCFTNIVIGQGVPTGYVSNFLDVDATDNNNASIVQYSSSRAQLVQGNLTYGTLLLSSGNSVSKALTAPVTVSATLAIRNNVNFRDMGYQISGNTNPDNEINLENAVNARLSLGSGRGTNTQYVTFVPLVNLPAGIALPPNVAPNVATTFPTYPDAKVNIGTASLVNYIATAAQQVRGNIIYGNLEVSAADPIAGADMFDKNVVSGPLTVRGNLTVNTRTRLIDNGFQISRETAGGTLTMNNQTQLVLGTATIATQFPVNFTAFTISAGNLTIYNAGVNQQMSTAPQYGSVLLNNPNNALPIAVKSFVPSNPVSIQGNLTINAFNNLTDNGSQIARTLAGGTITIRGGASAAEGGFLTLGNAAIATTFPINFSTRVIEPNSTVIYNASVAQNVAAFNNNDNTSYWNLTINSEDLSVDAVKTLLGPTRVRGNLRINQRNHLRDNGFQLTGSATGLMTMEANSRLELDHVAANGSSTLFPLNYVRANISLNVSSTVLYGSDDAQLVSSEPVYGNIEFRKFSVAAPLVNKTVQPNGTDALLQVNGNLSIYDFNHLIDNGLQITGTPLGNMLMENEGRLTLGTQGVSGVATLFPNQFGSINLEANLSPKNLVVFNSDKAGNNIAGQNTGGVPFSYGHVQLISGGAAVTKFLLHNVDIRGDLLIENNNTLDVSASNFNITLGRHWLNNGGVFTARSGRVICNGNTVDNLTQRILTNNSAFYDITFNNALGFTMEDNCRITHEANFTNGIVSPLTNQMMIFLATGSVAGPGTFPGAPGPSNNSFVNGRVQKIGNTAFMFPIGKVIDATTRWYAPAGITAPADPATVIMAEYFPVNPNVPGYNTSLIERPPLDRVSEVEYWEIEKVAGSTAASNAVKITLSWDTPRSGGVTQEGQLRVAHWQNRSGDTRWWDEGNEAFTGTMTRGTLRAADAVTTFSPFTLGSLIPNNPLPVELVFFRATVQNDGTVLTQWETANEINNDYFAIERSSNGSEFVQIGTVPGKGTTRIRQNYQWLDKEPLRGTSYYRLRQIDNDGTYSYSRIVAVINNADGVSTVALYPNPSDGSRLSVMVNNAQGKSVKVTIADLTGRTLLQNNLTMNAEGRSSLELPFRLPAGTYIATIEYGGMHHRRTFIVQ